MKTAIVSSLVLALLTLAPCRGMAKFLSVPIAGQEQTNWCWAGCTQSVLSYYGTSVSQGSIATTACRNHSPAWCTPCTTDAGYCGTNPTDPNCCNRSNCLYGAGGCIADLLQTWGVNSTGSTGTLSLTTIRTEINTNCRPIIINWYWTSGGGHYIVARGVNSGNEIYYMNPLPVGSGGYHIASYSWVVSSSDHTWQYSLRMTTTHSCPGPDVVRCEPKGGANPHHPPTYWYDVTPVNGSRCDFHVETFDPIASHYSNWILPSGWNHYIWSFYGKLYICFINPGCTNPISSTFRFQFDNPYGASWGEWVTGLSGG
jgi:hypothetical protein